MRPMQFTANDLMAAVIGEVGELLNLPPVSVVRTAIALLATVAQNRQHGLVPALIDADGRVWVRLTGIEGE